MGRIATDVVLLPDRAMTQWAIRVNRDLARQCGSQIVLGEKTCLPHVSLAMGYTDERDIDRVRERLEKLAEETPIRQLSATGIHALTNSRGECTSLLEIERTGELQALHEAVMRQVEPLFDHDVTEEMIADDTVAESTLEWVRNYPQKAAFERFSPHITLGYGEAQTSDRFPISFAVVQLALCHVGNHGTCRRVIVAVRLP
ncbi:MAG: 2'-5' RNA ligase family protein [Sedimentisphaerales bacterium]|nr:2'-5' RNA ligase family protein [Sedimentisphaerales bacterium]